MKNFYRCLIITVVAVGTYIFGAFGAAVACMSSDTAKTTPLPVLMYHNITKKAALRSKYAVTAAEFESDLQYLQKNGYTSISVQQLTDYAYNGTPLPDRPVIITIDDGFESFYAYAYPLLEKYDCKAVVNVVGAYAKKYTELERQGNPDCHNLDYSYLNFDEIKKLADSGIAEIGCHTYDMHTLKGRRGCGKTSGESEEAYEKALSADIAAFRQASADCLDGDSLIFAYPYGIYSPQTPDILRKNGFIAVFDCTEKINRISRGDISYLFHLHRYNRPGGVSSESFFAKMN